MAQRWACIHWLRTAYAYESEEKFNACTESLEEEDRRAVRRGVRNLWGSGLAS